jgi:hypothetical protein
MAAAFGGLAHAANVDRLYYRGWDNRTIRRRMQQVAKGQWTVPAATDADRAGQAAISEATQAAVTAAVDAAVRAAAAAAAAASGS